MRHGRPKNRVVDHIQAQVHCKQSRSPDYQNPAPPPPLFDTDLPNEGSPHGRAPWHIGGWKDGRTTSRGDWLEGPVDSTRIFLTQREPVEMPLVFSLCGTLSMKHFPHVDRSRAGILAALAAFFLWGILPIFWKLLGFLTPPSIVAQRTVWSLLLVFALLFWQGEGRALLVGIKSPRVVGWHLLSGALLASNWLDRKSTRLNSSHALTSRMPSSA